MRIGPGLVMWLAIVASWPAAGQDAERESFDLRVPVAPAPVPSQGRVRLFHELHLANYAGDTLVVERVQVQGGDGAVLADYADEALRQRLATPVPGAGSGNAQVVAPGATRVLHV